MQTAKEKMAEYEEFLLKISDELYREIAAVINKGNLILLEKFPEDCHTLKIMLLIDVVGRLLPSAMASFYGKDMKTELNYLLHDIKAACIIHQILSS